MCKIFWPDRVGQGFTGVADGLEYRIWKGQHGRCAMIHEGEPLAVTSDGVRHEI